MAVPDFLSSTFRHRKCFFDFLVIVLIVNISQLPSMKDRQPNRAGTYMHIRFVGNPLFEISFILEVAIIYCVLGVVSLHMLRPVLFSKITAPHYLNKKNGLNHSDTAVATAKVLLPCRNCVFTKQEKSI